MAGKTRSSTMPRPAGVQALALACALAVAAIAGAIGAIASVDAAAFYAGLARPAWAPPASVFGPVWSVLYALMGIASWLAWRSAPRPAAALPLYALQLAVNALWSWLFFGWHLGAAAFVDAVLLLGLIVATMLAFRRASRTAAMLLLPYLAWVGFACALTWAVWRANPALLSGG